MPFNRNTFRPRPDDSITKRQAVGTVALARQQLTVGANEQVLVQPSTTEYVPQAEGLIAKRGVIARIQEIHTQSPVQATGEAQTA